MSKRQNPESFTDYGWIFMISDKGMTLKFSSEAMAAAGKQLRHFQRIALPWVLTGLTTFGGTAGVVNWLRQQPETPATSPTEEVAPRR